MCNAKGDLLIGRYLKYFEDLILVNPMKAGWKAFLSEPLGGHGGRAPAATWTNMKIHDLQRFLQLHRLQPF